VRCDESGGGLRSVEEVAGVVYEWLVVDVLLRCGVAVSYACCDVVLVFFVLCSPAPNVWRRLLLVPPRLAVCGAWGRHRTLTALWLLVSPNS